MSPLPTRHPSDRLRVILRRLHAWEEMEGTDVIEVGYTLLLDVKQCLESVIEDVESLER